MTAKNLLIQAAYFITLFVVNLFFALLILYISQKEDKMNQSMLQNISLLNGMHEGILILSKLKKSILFVNKPAQKLLKNTINFC